MEFIRMSIVYPHLIACCVAIGLVFTSDVEMVRQLLTGAPEAPQDQSHLPDLQRTVAWALVALWVSGIAIISLDAWSQGLAYFRNPKLQAKVAIVVLLTLNGCLLHKAVLPALQRAGSLLHLPLGSRMLAVFAGVVSGVSWFYAAMLGIGRPLNWKYSLVEILGAFPVLVAGGFAAMLALAAWAKARNRDSGQPFQDVPAY
ncbi:MAG: hypothetical protein ABI409_07540 [Ramlibacter sp.]